MLLKRLRSSLRIKLSILFITVLILILLMPKGRSLESELTVGTIWLADDLIADRAFTIEKDSELVKAEVSEALSRVFPVYVFEEHTQRKILDSLNAFHSRVKAGLLNEQSSASGLEVLSPSARQMLKTIAGLEKQSQRPPFTLESLASKSARVISRILGKGLIDSSAGRNFLDSIAVRSRNVDIIKPLNTYYSFADRRRITSEAIRQFALPADQAGLLNEYVLYLLKPNIRYDAKLTAEEREIAEKKIQRNYGIVNENERIIAKHERVTADVKLKIDSYRKAKGGDIGFVEAALQGLGKYLHVFSLLLLFSIYLFLFRKKIYEDNLKLTVFSLLLLWICFISYLVNFIPFGDSMQFLIFIPAASMLITIMFDSRIGFYATVIYSLVCGATRGNDYPFVVMNIVAGALGVYTVRDIRNRVQIFRSFVYILIGYAITILAFGLERYDNFANIVTELGVAATNALISPVLTYGLLVFFEKIFHITTELTLLELSNSDHPLLRELAKKAPGSFSHSMQMGLLAESAALSIGANSLLARVGAYYHDIGKIYSPKVFVENQAKGVNIHDELRPEDSVRALKEHILRGKERAKKFGLPEEIIDFIPMHHGTTVMSFFYEKAKKFYGEDEVNIADYRYAGPKPNTKETAIVMLADTCESAVRSIEAPDWSKVDNLVNNLIDRRIEDGQLDESQLTLGDIQRVQTAFVEVLAGQTSVRRIRYPEQDDLEKSE